MQHKKFLITITVVLATGALGLSIANSRRVRGPASPQGTPPNFLQTQNGVGRRGQGARNLSLQPEAFNMGQRLGTRFAASRRETSITMGTLLIGSEQRQVQIKRVQTHDGEGVEIRFSGSADILTWDALQGPLSSGRRAEQKDREVIDRILRDSPDQFVLAQLRGARYFTVAHNVRPVDAGDNYQGPLWTIVRIDDPEADQPAQPESRWRLYYIDTRTGLIERVESEVNGQRIVAEFSGWTERNGEKVPGEIVWSSQGRTLMEYRLAAFSHSQQ